MESITQPVSTYSETSVCVTGGAGFIGSHLVDALVELRAKVRVIDDLSNGRAENLVRSRDSINFIQASILDRDALGEALAGCDVVFHQAALGSVPQSVENPLQYHNVNSEGTLRLLECARQSGVRRVVYASSSSVYGESEELPKTEDMLPAPVSPYAASKLMGEHWGRAYSHCYGIQMISLRYFNVFGPRQRPDSQYAAVVPAFAAALRNGAEPVVYGDGLQSRDFTHVANVIAANLRAGSVATDLHGEVINIACGKRYTLLDLLEVMSSAIGVEARCDMQPDRAGDVRHSQADISRARALIGYETVVPFEDGLRDTMAAFPG